MKIKEGGGMDIQEEREAFECELKQTDYYIAHGDLSTLMLCDDQYALDDVQVSFEMWQAAKAQSDQKVKLLLCDEHLKKCESPTGIFNSQYPDEEPCLICLAKEAKAQAVPEGFVLMPIKPTKTMVMAVAKEHEGDAFLPYSLYDAYVKQAMIEAQEPAND